MIVDQEEHHHAPLLALMILSLGDEYLQRSGIGKRRDNQMDCREVRAAEPQQLEGRCGWMRR